MNELQAGESQMSGQAGRIPRQVTADEAVGMLQSQGGTIRAEVQIIRAGTGKVENYTLVMGDEAKET